MYKKEKIIALFISIVVLACLYFGYVSSVSFASILQFVTYAYGVFLLLAPIIYYIIIFSLLHVIHRVDYDETKPHELKPIKTILQFFITTAERQKQDDENFSLLSLVNDLLDFVLIFVSVVFADLIFLPLAIMISFVLGKFTKLCWVTGYDAMKESGDLDEMKQNLEEIDNIGSLDESRTN